MSKHDEPSDREPQAEHANESQLRALAESIDQVLWLADARHTKMLYVNPAYDEVFGRSRDTLYQDGRDWIRALHPEDRLYAEKFVDDVCTRPRSFQYRIVRGSAVRTIRASISPVVDASGTVIRIAGTASDITERLELEDQVRQSQKLESLGLLAGGIAHDFNNVLAVIGANAEMLSQASLVSDDRELISEIHQAVLRATTMTRQLLAFSRKQVTMPTVVDVNTEIANTCRMLRRMVGDDIVITTSLDPELRHVRIDPGHLVQLLMNLAVNSRDAMPLGGTLALVTRNLEGKRGPEVMISVADTGTGMSPEVKARVFEPLFTTKGIGKGTGLGLSVVRGITETVGGHIELRSEVGSGTTFELYLPATDTALPKREHIATDRSRGNERIVVVDDDPFARASASRALRSRGYTVLEASDGQAALQLLREHGGHLDLLVTDVVMPNMDGRQLAEAALQVRPDMRVLYTSGYTDDAVLRHGVQHAEVPFIEKPFGIQALAGKVRQILDAASTEAPAVDSPRSLSRRSCA
jgi:PAS domain S-box-containing protein